MCGQHTRLDILINNAAQTVRKPAAFYEHLLEGEATAVDDALTHVLANDDARVEVPPSALTTSDGVDSQIDGHDRASSGDKPHLAGQTMLSSAAAMSQIAVLPEDADSYTDAMPRGRLDEDEQQIDLRATNSWKLELGEISAAE